MKCLLALLIVGAHVGVVSSDFAITDTLREFTFIYNSFFNLLLTVHDDSCYGVRMDGSLHNNLMDRFQFTLEEQVKSIILTSDETRLTPVTPAEFRNTFADPEADFYCRDKDIYIMVIDYVECDFEKYQTPCAWTPDTTKNLEWIMDSGGTPSILTGPEADHTLGTEYGTYLYMEANKGDPGQMADLVSPPLKVDPTIGMCFRFWYSMYGYDIGTLKVVARDMDTPSNNITLWSKSKNQGKGWRLAEVSVPRDIAWTQKMQLLMIAQRGSTHYGDIAIDDISSTVGLCPASMLTCSFEAGENLCDWSQVEDSDSMNFKINSGPTHTTGTGPDQAMQLPGSQVNNNYLYLEGNDGLPGDAAELHSKFLHLHGPICLQFYYHMKGTGLGELVVKKVDQGLTRTLLTRTSNDETTDWTRARVTITPHDLHHPTQVIIRAVRGRSSVGDIAIDLLTGLTGSCDQYDDLPAGPTSPAMPVG